MNETHHHAGSHTAGAVAELKLEGAGASSQSADLPLLGMSCSACAVRIEKALNKAEGVENATVNFATTRATVKYDPAQTDPKKLREAVRSAGYDAIVQEPTAEGAAPAQSLQDAEVEARDKEYNDQKRKFIIALILTIPGRGHRHGRASIVFAGAAFQFSWTFLRRAGR